MIDRYGPLLIILIMALSLSGCLKSGSDDGGDLHGIQENISLASFPVALEEGQTGSVSIPLVGANFIETHIKHHWEMAENVSGVLVNVTWEGTGWNLDLDIGTGDCPDSGMTMASASGSSGTISVEFMAKGNSTLTEGRWFCHLGINDPGSKRGQTLNYFFEVHLLSYEEIECEGGVCPV